MQGRCGQTTQLTSPAARAAMNSRSSALILIMASRGKDAGPMPKEDHLCASIKDTRVATTNPETCRRSDERGVRVSS